MDNKLTNFGNFDDNILGVFSPIDFQSIEFSNNPNLYLGLNSFLSPGKLINPNENTYQISDQEIEKNSVEKIFKCDYETCNRTYTTIGNLKTHQKHHTGNYSFKCKESKCDKMFLSSYALKIHMRSHTNERPYSCTYNGCLKSFTTLYKLKQHDALHSKLLYKCHICGNGFNTKQAFISHKKKLNCTSVSNKDKNEIETDMTKQLSAKKTVNVDNDALQKDAAVICDIAKVPSCCDSNVISSQVVAALLNNTKSCDLNISKKKCCSAGVNSCSMVETRSLSIVCSCCKCPQPCCQRDSDIQKKCPSEIPNVTNIINNIHSSGMALKEITQHMRDDNGQLSLVIQMVIGVPQLQ